MRQRRPLRTGFTLLEVVLATAIAVLLLGALYVAVDMQLGYSQMSRDLVDESTLSRSLFTRMDNDASQVIGLPDPARYRFQNGMDTPDIASSSNGGAPGGMGNNSPGGATGNTPASSSSTNQNGSDASAAASSSGALSSFGDSTAISDGNGTTKIVLPFGVEGDSQTLHLFVGNLPREIFASGHSFADISSGAYSPPTVGDVRRISYWLAGGEGSPAGLARQDVPVSTGDDALENLPPGLDNEGSYIIADEVRGLSFQYFDGQQWWDTWDSTQPGPDGVTPIGSPAAISVTVTVAVPHTAGQPGADSARTYHHTLYIPSANGISMLSQAMTGTGSSSATTQPTQSNSNGGGASP
jgi:prepilin-type N-terminal cleavage/methylation domain-containing protein